MCPEEVRSQYIPGHYSSFTHDGHRISVILTDEFVSRYISRKPDPVRTKWLIEEGVKDPLDTLIAMSGTRSLSAILKAQKTKINLVLLLKRGSGEPPRIKVIAKTVHVGEFFPNKLKDYEFRMEGSPGGSSVKVAFERDYEKDLIQAVLEDLSKIFRTLKDGAGYHLGDEIIDYIAEREGNIIRIADAMWAEEFYVYEFQV